MKTQPKKLRSFAISTSKNKKIFAVGFSLGWAKFYVMFFCRSTLCFHARKNRYGWKPRNYCVLFFRVDQL